jgi:hypothetical protein
MRAKHSAYLGIVRELRRLRFAWQAAQKRGEYHLDSWLAALEKIVETVLYDPNELRS